MGCIKKADLARIVVELGLEDGVYLRDMDTYAYVQKAVYLLKEAGLLKANCRYDIFYRGPYSKDLEAVLDSLSRAGLDGIRVKAGESKVVVPEAVKKACHEVLEAAAIMHRLAVDWAARGHEYTLKDVEEHMVWLRPWGRRFSPQAVALLDELGIGDILRGRRP